MTGATNDGAFTVDIADDGAVLVHGDIDVAGGPQLDTVLAQRSADRPLVVDLAGVSFIDSSGLRSLLAAAQRARQGGGDVVLRNVGPKVGRLLDITGTTSQFRVEPLP